MAARKVKKKLRSPSLTPIMTA